jgi:hypothetical protein
MESHTIFQFACRFIELLNLFVNKLFCSVLDIHGLKIFQFDFQFDLAVNRGSNPLCRRGILFNQTEARWIFHPEEIASRTVQKSGHCVLN